MHPGLLSGSKSGIGPSDTCTRPAPAERQVYSDRAPDDSLKLRRSGMDLAEPHRAADGACDGSVWELVL